MENAVADAKKALESNDKAQMDRAREALTKIAHKLADEMYKAAQAKGPGAGGPGGPTAGAGPEPGANGGGQKKDEGVIDAEYVDVEDKK